jgi:two-component system sensor histidine kinase/response regulator
VRIGRLLEALTDVTAGDVARRAARPDDAPPPSASAIDAGGVPTARILVAEDNLVNQTVIRRMLEKRRCRVEIVGNGVAAVQAVGAETYDLVFMDCHMPELDGFEATRVIRDAETGARRVPIVAFTADAVTDTRERCEAAGMDDCVTKPVTTEALTRILARWTRVPVVDRRGPDLREVAGTPS